MKPHFGMLLGGMRNAQLRASTVKKGEERLATTSALAVPSCLCAFLLFVLLTVVDPCAADGVAMANYYLVTATVKPTLI
jgi:hypothetical protein